MNHFIIAVSFIASIFTIGDISHKILTGQDYNLFAGIILVVVIFGIQLSFQVILEIKADAKDKYVPILFFIFIPIVIASASWGYYNQAILPEANLDLAISESIKISLLIVTTVFLFLYWANIFDLKFFRKPTYLGVAYGIPAMIMLSTIVYRYTFNNYPLDGYFGGFLFLLLITILSAAITKSEKIRNILSIFKISQETRKSEHSKSSHSPSREDVSIRAVIVTIFVTIICSLLFWNGKIFGGIILPILSFLAFKFDTVADLFDKFAKEYNVNPSEGESPNKSSQSDS